MKASRETREGQMSYYFAKTLDMGFDEAVDRVKAVLKEDGFGVLSEIDVQHAMKEKLGKEFRPYRILGACNPPLAFQALQAEDKIGTMLPCNVVVQQTDEGTEVAAIDPVASMAAVGNEALARVAAQVRERLMKVIAGL
jgi:uncharacterized protein (DUF302 family)